MTDNATITRFLHEYHDRGMLKWQGFYLSDHTSALKKKTKQEEIKNKRKLSPAMELNDISAKLLDAYCNNLRVEIELKEYDQNHVTKPFIKGLVKGYYQDRIKIGDEIIKLSNINAIHFKH